MGKTLKIVHFVNGRCNFDSANGVDKTIYYLTKELSSLDLEIHLISATKKDLVPIDGVFLHRVAPFRSVWFCGREIQNLIDELKPDLGHFHSAYVPENLAVARSLRKAGVPYFVTPNGNCSRELLRRKPWMKRPFKHFFERPYLNRAIAVQSVGDCQAIRDYGVQAPVFRALNGICRSTIPESLDDSMIRTLLPKFANRFIFCFVGRLDVEQKGLDLLIKAVSMLGPEKSKLGVLLVGPGWKKSVETIEGLIREHGVGDEFHLHGPVYGDEKFSLISGSDAFIHTSRWEGLPFAVVEAMAVGQLCVTTRAADPAGLLKRNQAGVVCEPSVEGVANALKEAVSLNEAGRRDRISKATDLVSTEMAWPGIAEKVAAKYREVLGESAHGTS